MRTSLVVTFALLALACAGGPPAVEAPAVPDTPTVAVLYFDYEGEDADLLALQKGLAQMVITDLSSNAGYRVVERDRLEDILAELKLNRSEHIDPKKAVEIGKLVGADLTVMGSYFEAMGVFRIDTRIVDTATSVVTCGVGETGKKDDFLGIESRLSDKLSVAVLSDGQDCSSPRPDRPPPTPVLPRKPIQALPVATAATWSRALDAIDRDQPDEAKALLQEVVKVEPAFSLASDELASLLK
jgi:TolB-like protein